MNKISNDFSRALVLVRNETEKTLINTLLTEQTEAFYIFTDPQNLLNELAQGANALILTSDTLNENLLSSLKFYLEEQPTWSNLPVLIIAEANYLNSATKNFCSLNNIILLEQPLCKKSFLSILKACIADRTRQYEIRNLNLSLEVARTEVERANKAKNEFLSNMSHEIRTPLGAILGFSELISQPRLTFEERTEYALIVKRNGHVLSALVDDILDLSNVESGKLLIEEAETNIDDILNEVLSTLQLRSKLKNIPIVVEKSSHIPKNIKTDSVRLRQILINLIDNALKFTEAGQIKVKISIYRLNTKNNEENKLIFDISDSGIGISPADHLKLFQAFFQADGSSTRKFGGTGLGLALSRQLARALGGDLRLKSSRLGHGSTFQFSIRVTCPNTKGTKNNFFSTLKGLKVLVADDSPDNQTLISRILTREGASVDTAENGEIAVAKALEDDFNVVLMDMQMPKLNGIEATVELRRHGYPGPIVALSAYTRAEDQARGLSAGCDLYLTKPIDKTKLLQLLQTYRNQEHLSAD